MFLSFQVPPGLASASGRHADVAAGSGDNVTAMPSFSLFSRSGHVGAAPTIDLTGESGGAVSLLKPNVMVENSLPAQGMRAALFRALPAGPRIIFSDSTRLLAGDSRDSAPSASPHAPGVLTRSTGAMACPSNKIVMATDQNESTMAKSQSDELVLENRNQNVAADHHARQPVRPTTDRECHRQHGVLKDDDDGSHIICGGATNSTQTPSPGHREVHGMPDGRAEGAASRPDAVDTQSDKLRELCCDRDHGATSRLEHSESEVTSYPNLERQDGSVLTTAEREVSCAAPGVPGAADSVVTAGSPEADNDLPAVSPSGTASDHLLADSFCRDVMPTTVPLECSAEQIEGTGTASAGSPPHRLSYSSNSIRDSKCTGQRVSLPRGGRPRRIVRRPAPAYTGIDAVDTLPKSQQSQYAVLQHSCNILLERCSGRRRVRYLDGKLHSRARALPPARRGEAAKRFRSSSMDTEVTEAARIMSGPPGSHGPPPPVDAEDGQYLVEDLLEMRVSPPGKRICRRTTQYLVSWMGYGDEHNCWVDEGDIHEGLVRSFLAYGAKRDQARYRLRA
ncbi:MAG: hypothetical protein M1822_008842 [Bathelium mastoideum]|nr:MAG: hypothetical protein M1822_008842 [Bathelium mastoideum]